MDTFLFVAFIVTVTFTCISFQDDVYKLSWNYSCMIIESKGSRHFWWNWSIIVLDCQKFVFVAWVYWPANMFSQVSQYVALGRLLQQKGDCWQSCQRAASCFDQFWSDEKKNVSISLITWSCDSGFSWFLSFVRVMKKKKCQQKPKWGCEMLGGMKTYRESLKKQENYSKFWAALYKYAAVGKLFFIENCNSLIKITKQSNP